MNEGLRALINGAGVLAEISKVQYDAFVKTGFSESQAMYLTGKFIQAELEIANEVPNDD